MAICDDVPSGRQAVADLAARIPETDDFDVVAGLLMEAQEITGFLQDWSYVATDGANAAVRAEARAALSHTGMYGDGTNPITGAELASNLQSADSYWADLADACTELG